MARTIQETIDRLHSSLKEYIEATYHIGDPSLIQQRRNLLERVGVTHQEPFLETTPKYQLGTRFAEIRGLPAAARDVFEMLSEPRSHRGRLLFDPPYRHQGDAIRSALIAGSNLVIMTGTGSGKTESFLLPILGKFANEAAERPKSFSQPAMRALLLYPMNALVNDQLGRLRAIFGDPELVKLFTGWSGRPPRFARYTSRTAYAGVRSGKKDGRKLTSFEQFYVEIERQANQPPSDEQMAAARLRSELKARGKWPAKPDLVKWFGEKGSRWYDPQTGEFLRAVTLPEDSELITRHEVQAICPDLMVTNYSMLEYMMMRPIERSIFDNTRIWLENNVAEKFTVVLDEAHLYRGAAGAEVGLLLRRLRDRLGIPIERFQVICATASFNDKIHATEFGAQLSGVSSDSFVAITGDLELRANAAVGSTIDAEVLASLDLARFYSPEESDRASAIAPFLAHRGVTGGAGVERDLYNALNEFPPLGRLVNLTMGNAQPVEELGIELFPDSPDIADRAITALLALGSVAREKPDAPGPLPCRIHNFYRGLPGLWVCMDPDCTQISSDERNGICGRLYSQPHEICGCGAPVLELFTCRSCGSAYARAYSDDVDSPDALWSEPGRRLRMPGGETRPLLDLDILLEKPRNLEAVELAEYDLETGRLSAGMRTRNVWIRKDRVTPPADEESEEGGSHSDSDHRGRFVPCGVCNQTANGRTTVQDHQTKGDQPFQSLVSRQLAVQPPGKQPATPFAPLRGRKVLVFSDSRQVAARLAPNLQMYSVRDALRSLIVRGFSHLLKATMAQQLLSLEELYLAALLGSQELEVRLRPELKPGESLAATEDEVRKALTAGALTDETQLFMLVAMLKGHKPPASLLDDIVKTVQDRYLGLEALALASIREAPSKMSELHGLPSIPGVAETEAQKVELVRAWLRCWRPAGFWLNSMPTTWYKRKGRGTSVGTRKGTFKAWDVVLKDKEARKAFKVWLPRLLGIFATDMGGGNFRLDGQRLSLQIDGDWRRCGNCKSVHRPVSTIGHCLDCGSDEIFSLDPQKDAVFSARKGYYRSPVVDALATPPDVPVALIAAEHTAQLNAPQSEDVFSKAEENELLFQDVNIDWSSSGRDQTAIDVLSSTTTMEVGIDIGALSGVALRNMPPGRANYQQRAGRAGRRGNAVATVVAFGSADSHDEHYFSSPKEMISGKVIDPKLTLDNPDIVKRHVRAYLLQSYHQVKLPVFDPEADPDLFSVLGSIQDFRTDGTPLNVHDFRRWLTENESMLRERVSTWIPAEMNSDLRVTLLEDMVTDCIGAVEMAIANDSVGGDKFEKVDDDGAGERQPELPDEVGEEAPPQKLLTGKLLDRLLYKGVLPRYAFPTDVATFNVFDRDRSTDYRPVTKFAPSQGLPVALSQYAPGKQVWISGKCYTSGAIYSPMAEDRFNAWQNRRLYRECADCHYAHTVKIEEGLNKDEVADCHVCGGKGTFGPARFWLRPPGFAHPFTEEEVTSPDDMPETSYATRAKLVMQTPPADDDKWTLVNDRIRVMSDREHLLVSNTGPKEEGYNYCTLCGLIESSAEGTAKLFSPHPKPYPDREPTCPGNRSSRHIVLGTDFITDIALFSMTVEAPLKLKPGSYPTDVALRTVSEALAKAACTMLELETGELMAEYRPAVTLAGLAGLQAEIFLYDTLPGGAGFSRQLADRGEELFQRALSILKTCPENCDSSCYRCLRSFKNKFEHGHLDRHVGAELIEFLLTDAVQPFSPTRVAASTRKLLLDLQRNTGLGIDYEGKAKLDVPGLGEVEVPILATRKDGARFVIAIAGPLTGDHPADSQIGLVSQHWDGGKVIPINELLVRGHLPAATRRVQAEVLQ